MKSLAAQLLGFGADNPLLRVAPVDTPAPGPREVRVRLLAAPVHPADLNVIEGKYGVLPILPATLGTEGCGLVVEVGDEVNHLEIGDQVVVVTPGNWCFERVVDAADVVKIPRDLDPVQASMLVINPLSAWAMIHSHGIPEAGAWLVQNAANSAVGRCVIQIAHRMKLRTLNLVRRDALRAELISLGADQVCVDDAEFARVAEQFTVGVRPKLGFNAVGGVSALTVANALADGGELITYGAMARQPLKIPNGMLIFRGLSFRGFWLRHWLAVTPRRERDLTIQRLAGWMQAGQLQMSIDQVYSLGAIREAVAAAQRSGRRGKIVLNLAQE